MEVPERNLSASAFEELALPLFDQLYNFAHWLTQNREEAEDLVQETYAKALRGFSSFRAGTNFRAWMFRILRNSFLNSRTGLKVNVEFDEEEHGSVGWDDRSSPEQILLGQAQRQAVQEALAALPVPYREIILLCDVEDMSYQEISETLSIPAGTVMSRLSRARKALRAVLRGKMQGEPHGV